MARSTRYIHLDKPKEQVEWVMQDYLTKERFSLIDWKGEPVYRGGEPLVLGYRYLKWSYNSGVLKLEVWIGGLFGKEYHLDSGFGAAHTSQGLPYKISLDHLTSRLEQPIPPGALVYANPYTPPDTQLNTQTAIPLGAQPDIKHNMPTGMQNNAPASANTPTQTMHDDNTATIAVVLGVLSIFLSGFFFVSLALAITGLALASGKKSPNQVTWARTGKIVCIIGLCVSPIIFLLEIAYVILHVLLG